MENERLVIAKEILEHELKLMCATRDDAHVSIADLMKRSKLKQEADLDAEGAEEKRKLQAAYAKQMGANSLSDKTRLKQADERNTEERRFIALDLVLHPELYVEASDEGEWGVWVGGLVGGGLYISSRPNTLVPFCCFCVVLIALFAHLFLHLCSHLP